MSKQTYISDLSMYGRSSPRLFAIMFRKIMEMHLLYVSGADNETGQVSMPVTALQSSSTMSWPSFQDPRRLSDFADTNTVAILFWDKASKERV